MWYWCHKDAIRPSLLRWTWLRREAQIWSSCFSAGPQGNSPSDFPKISHESMSPLTGRNGCLAGPEKVRNLLMLTIYEQWSILKFLHLKKHFILTKQFEIQPPKQGIHSNKSFSNEKVVVPMWVHGESKSTSTSQLPPWSPEFACLYFAFFLLCTFGIVPLSCNALAWPNVLYIDIYIYILYIYMYYIHVNAYIICKYIYIYMIYACKREHIVQVLLRLAKNSSTKTFPNGSNIKETHLKANPVVT